MIQIQLTNQYSRSQNLYGTDSSGTQWHVDSFDGWDGPEVRQDQKHIVKRHGAKIGEWFYGPRPMVIKGTFWAPTEGAMWDARDRLADTSSGFDQFPVTMFVTEPTTGGGSKTFGLEVWRSGRLQIDTKTSQAAQFQVPLLAPDPRKYLTPTHNVVLNGSGGLTNLTVGGSISTDPIITWNASTSFAGPVVVWSQDTSGTVGADFQLNVPHLNSGDVLVVNFGTRTVTLNGVSRFDFVDPISSWWDLIPGVTNTIRSSTAGSQQTISWQDAYI